MPCNVANAALPDGTPITVIVCSRGVRQTRCKCGRVSTAKCDWKLHGPKEGKTCDVNLCDSCRVRVGDNKDLCQAHNRVWQTHPANPKNQTGER